MCHEHGELLSVCVMNMVSSCLCHEHGELLCVMSMVSSCLCVS